MMSCGDGCCGNGGSTAENVYSTEETICGKWIDGKQIYRKVITGTFVVDSGNALVFTNVSDLKIDRLINLYGNSMENNNIVQFTLPANHITTVGTNAAVNMYYHSGNGNILYHYSLQEDIAINFYSTSRNF